MLGARKSDLIQAMLADPVEGYLAGVTSAPARVLIAAGAAVLGFGVCILPVTREPDALLMIPMLVFFSIFRWAVLGGWFFAGLCAFVGMFAWTHAFLMERTPKLSLFAVFTCAAVYLAPITFRDDWWLSSGDWRISLASYVGAALVYWLLPRMISHLHDRRSG